jgi:DNA-binding NtrC family response regulator
LQRALGALSMLDVLLIEHDDIARARLAGVLVDAGHRTSFTSDAEAAMPLLQARAFYVALGDARRSREDVRRLAGRIRRAAPGTVIFHTPRLGAGAWGRGREPDDVAMLFEAGARSTPRAVESSVELSSPAQQVWQRIRAAATIDAAVFVSGDCPTGNRRIAGVLHDESARREGPLITIPCDALHEMMTRAELRELERPRARSRGEWVRAAEGGTLVLDGVDTLPPAVQQCLVGLLDDPEVRAHDEEGRPRGARLVALSATTPAELLARGALSLPLLFRLNAVHVRAAPRRAREEYVLPQVVSA